MKDRRLYLRDLGKVAGLRVYLVSGEHVRNHIDIDFTMGGNEAVYPRYVPAGEIWLDDAAHWLDRNATALHEIVERHQMMVVGKDYNDAHEVASAVERPFRRELTSLPLRGLEVGRLGAAYAGYLATPNTWPITPRPNDRPRSGRELDAEIARAISPSKRRPVR